MRAIAHVAFATDNTITTRTGVVYTCWLGRSDFVTCAAVDVVKVARADRHQSYMSIPPRFLVGRRPTRMLQYGTSNKIRFRKHLVNSYPGKIGKAAAFVVARITNVCTACTEKKMTLSIQTNRRDVVCSRFNNLSPFFSYVRTRFTAFCGNLNEKKKTFAPTT